MKILWSTFRHWLFRKRMPKTTGRKIDFRNCFWGHNIMQINPDKKLNNVFTALVISTPIPCRGDDIILSMKSGKDAIHRVVKSEPCGDPSDMAKIMFGIVGYLR